MLPMRLTIVENAKHKSYLDPVIGDNQQLALASSR
jgi:hypothetical protein